MIINPIQIEISREGTEGQWVEGRYQPGERTKFWIEGSIQPTNPQVLRFLPAAARKYAEWTLHVDDLQPLLILSDLVAKKAGDILSWQGKQYGVIMAADWRSHRTGLPHVNYYLVAIQPDAQVTTDG